MEATLEKLVVTVEHLAIDVRGLNFGMRRLDRDVRQNGRSIKAIDAKVDVKFGALEGKFKSLEDKVDRNGVLLEAANDNILKLVEGQEMLHEKTDRMQGALSTIEEKVEQIDARLLCVKIVPK